MLLAILVLAAAGVAGVPLRSRLVLALLLVAAYVPLAGGGPSIQRAGVMGAAGPGGRAGRAAGVALVRARARRGGDAGAEPAGARRSPAGSSRSRRWSR